MCRNFLKYIIFLCLSALISLPANALQQQKGTGKGDGKGQQQASGCQDKENPTLTLIINDTQRWVYSPDEVMELPGHYEITKGANKRTTAINLGNLIANSKPEDWPEDWPEGWPEGWNGGRVSFISCKGQRINVPSPYLKNGQRRYVIMANQRGFLKLVIKKGKSGNVLMRDLRRIDIR